MNSRRTAATSAPIRAFSISALLACLGVAVMPPQLAAAAERCPNQAIREEQHSTYLPDCRAYELVSPAEKDGADVLTNTYRTRAASDGEAVEFGSLENFADSRGSSLGAEYMSVRTGLAGTTGWATHAITPAEPPLTFLGALIGASSYEGDMSPDLEHGVFRAFRPLAEAPSAPNVSEVQNLYVRNDLRAPGAGSYQLTTDSVAPLGLDPFAKPFFAGASADFSKVIFESELDLAAGATGTQTKLYEWSGGATRLAGMIPPPGQTECTGSACEPASSSQAGLGATLQAETPHMVSADGSRVFFQSPAGVGGGNLYMRVNGTSTVQLNVSEGTVPESLQPARLWTASDDGTRIFFTTGELYMYDTTAPAGHRLTLLSQSDNPTEPPTVSGVVGASEDGQYVYFGAAGQLVAGEPALGTNTGLYLWHGGSVTFIGNFSSLVNFKYNLPTNTWDFEKSADQARVSADGKHVMFMVTKDQGFIGRFGFPGYDHGGGEICALYEHSPEPCRELYVYSDDLHVLSCASCNPSGAAAVGETLTAISHNSSNVALSSHLPSALSSDGRYVFFSTPESLVPQDTNGKYDAYEYDTETRTVHLLSSGTSPEDSFFLDASADGSDAFVVTRSQLLGWDKDGAYDLYDVRVGGGLPEPPREPSSCSSDGCQGATATAPAAPSPSSAGVNGEGNLLPAPARFRPLPLHCRHGHVKRRIKGRLRCVVAHSKRHPRAKKARNHGGAR